MQNRSSFPEETLLPLYIICVSFVYYILFLPCFRIFSSLRFSIISHKRQDEGARERQAPPWPLTPHPTQFVILHKLLNCPNLQSFIPKLPLLNYLQTKLSLLFQCIMKLCHSMHLKKPQENVSLHPHSPNKFQSPGTCVSLNRTNGSCSRPSRFHDDNTQRDWQAQVVNLAALNILSSSPLEITFQIKFSIPV